MTLKSKAYQKLATVNPFTNSLHSKMITALMTNKKSPKVTKVTGKVNKTRIGFTNRFSNPSTMATIIEVAKLSTAIPGKKLAISSTNIAVTIIRRIKNIRSKFRHSKLKLCNNKIEFIKCVHKISKFDAIKSLIYPL